MALNDWSTLSGGLVAGPGGDIGAGATGGLGSPNGGGSFVYAARLLNPTPGAFGLYATPQPPNTDFNPLLKGGDIRGAMRRNGSGSAFLFIGAQGTTVGSTAYILGLSDADPAHIELRKGALDVGLPDEAPGGVSTVLRRSTTTIAPGTWVHLRLEMVWNPNGDVVLNAYQNDLTAHTVAAPTWEAIPGLASYLDDALSIASGSPALVGGRAGFAARFAAKGDWAAFDHMDLVKQT